MRDNQPYPNGRAVEHAIKQAANTKPDRVKSRALQAVTRDRFLCRVFTAAPDRWALKGGAGMLARIPQARNTLDIDLLSSEKSIDNAVAELTRLAGIDLGDHFYFTAPRTEEISRGEEQAYVEGVRVEFDVRIGAKHHRHIAVDLVVGPNATQPFETREPASRLELPRLQTVPYRLYAVVDQIADKVCAALEVHASGPSSRERDLVDIALLALTETIDAADLRRALSSEFARRSRRKPERFTTPASWGARYQKDAKDIGLLAGYPDVPAARDLVATLIDPALSQADLTGTWCPQRLRWLTA
ncbi:MAG: nucleotidyl transferase AbiEii/AbiGii toxin family protein [Cumulibacter sp.]